MRKTAVVALLVPLAILGAAGLAFAAERLELEVDGMVCPFCEAAVESILSSQPGVLEADADFRTRRAIVVYDPAETDPDTLADAINKRSFYRARPVEPSERGTAGAGAR
jgi:copper chaperone CopZ